MLSLKGKTCLFAGATGNLGKNAVYQLASQGVNVVMTTHDHASANAIIELCKDLPGTVLSYDRSYGPDRVLKEVKERFGSVDVYINKTGSMDHPIPLSDLTGEVLDQKLHQHITSVMMTIKDIIPYLKESSSPRIILTTSGGALSGDSKECITDNIARGGVISMTYALSTLLAPYHITVNCIAMSGAINDHMVRTGIDLDEETLLSQIPLSHLGTSEEYGALLSYLASEESGFTTGHIFNFTGGMYVG